MTISKKRGMTLETITDLNLLKKIKATMESMLEYA